ncbi:unnamed protein product [Allacma fusca]|uniref:DNA-directed RNA polymerase RBP11-like dimerisation domain-containing protein n=1 Tax=Allacma fusca TaxID=39272 RepID=A0A8J2JR05_9HEXA|nr:unnamed protein product [Allacma fusca]
MNVPPSFDTFLLPEGQPKIEAIPETNVANACKFIFHREDHTIGCLVRAQLLKNPKVLFAGYKTNNPFESQVIVRVQTVGGYAPIDAMKEAINDLLCELAWVHEQFQQETSEFLIKNGGCVPPPIPSTIGTPDGTPLGSVDRAPSDSVDRASSGSI